MNATAEPRSGPSPSADCIFCRIIAGKIPSDQVHSDDAVVAFHDLNPSAPVHVLVVPRAHTRDVRELAHDPELLAHVVEVAGEVAASLADGDFRLVFNTGEGAGQTVMHTHAHVLAGTHQTEASTAAGEQSTAAGEQ